MALIIPTGHFQAVLTFANPTSVRGITNIVLGFRSENGGTDGRLSDFAVAIADSWIANMLVAQDTSSVLTSVRCLSATQDGEASASAAGTSDFTLPPPNTAVLISHGTAFRGPRGRGRTFLFAAVQESKINEQGILDEDTRSATQAAWTGFIVDILTHPTEPAQHVILQGDVGESSPLSPPPAVTSSIVAGKVATQRKRLR